jgi:hypothetical protein
MKFLVYEVDVTENDIIEVTLSSQANVKIMDQVNFSKYKQNQRYQFVGGKALKSPLCLSAPGAGHWYVVIDLGGYAGSVSASVRVINS